MANGAIVARQPDKPLSVFRDCRECPEMIIVPAGTFMSGFSAKEKAMHGNPNIPLGVRATISKPFALGKYELTIAEYRACIDTGGCRFRTEGSGGMGNMASGQPEEVVDAIMGKTRGTEYDRLPMTKLAVEDIKDYLSWISRRTGKAYRLPTRMEWTHAARAGTNNAYPWGDKPQRNAAFIRGAFDEALYPELRGTKTSIAPFVVQRSYKIGAPSAGRHPVGLLASSQWGFHDMIGNVSEIIFDCRYDPAKPAPDISAITTQNSRATICVLGISEFFSLADRGIIPTIPYGESHSAGGSGSSSNGIRLYSEL